MADSKKSSISRRSSCYLLNLKQPDKTAKRLKMSFQRTAATVLMLKAERRVEASVGFLDVSETGAGIYTPELLHKGSHVELSITEPSPLKVRGIVAWSIPVQSGIHSGKFKCRSGIQFVLDSDAQKEAVAEFVRKAALDPVEIFKSSIAAATPPSSAEAATMAAMSVGTALDAVAAQAAGAAAPAEAPVAASPADPAAAVAAAPAADPIVAPAVAPAPDAAPVPPVAEVAAAPAPEAPAAPVAEAAPPAEAVPTEEPKAA